MSRGSWLLAAARETIVHVPFFWVVTPTPDGLGANARVVNAQSGQHDSGKAYVALSGPAELIDDREEVNRRFRGSVHDDPQGITAASLIAAKVTADHLELHVRGVTAEPWGRGRTLPERDTSGIWRLGRGEALAIRLGQRQAIICRRPEQAPRRHKSP